MLHPLLCPVFLQDNSGHIHLHFAKLNLLQNNCMQQPPWHMPRPNTQIDKGYMIKCHNDWSWTTHVLQEALHRSVQDNIRQASRKVNDAVIDEHRLKSAGQFWFNWLLMITTYAANIPLQAQTVNDSGSSYLQKVNDAKVDKHWLRLCPILKHSQSRNADSWSVSAPLTVQAPYRPCCSKLTFLPWHLLLVTKTARQQYKQWVQGTKCDQHLPRQGCWVLGGY